MDVASKEGEGTTFTVTVHLKLRDGGEEDLAPLEGIRVLVVDDDPVACEGACLLLSEIGMVPDSELSGRDGVSAVVRAEQEGNPYRAVILDWRMPEMSGLQCARAIREAAKNVVPIIILSAYDWSMIEQEAREVGVDAFISKPLYRSRLVQVMKELLTGETDAGVDEKALLEELSYAGKRGAAHRGQPHGRPYCQGDCGHDGRRGGARGERLAGGADAARPRGRGYYDVVLMDIPMPVMNGYEAATAIRKEGENRPELGRHPHHRSVGRCVCGGCEARPCLWHQRPHGQAVGDRTPHPHAQEVDAVRLEQKGRPATRGGPSLRWSEKPKLGV